MHTMRRWASAVTACGLMLLGLGARAQSIKQAARTAGSNFYQADFSSAAGWTLGTGWATDATHPGMVSFGFSPYAGLNPGATGYTFKAGVAASSDAGGVREDQVLIDSNGTWARFYGAGDGTSGAGGPWRVQLALSTDRGRTWVKQGPLDIGLSNGMGGTLPARDMGLVVKAGGTYYLFAYRAGGVSDDGTGHNVVPTPPYNIDIWTNTTLSATGWVYQNIPLNVTGINSADPDYSYIYHASILQDAASGNYIGFYGDGNQSGQVYGAGVATSKSILGPWTKLGPNYGDLFHEILNSPEAPERPVVFYNAAIKKWVLMVNENSGYGLSPKTNTGADHASYWLSDTLLNFGRLGTKVSFQHHSPLDGDGQIVGTPAVLYGPECAVIQNAQGYVPYTYDSFPSTPLAHGGRRILYSTLEPSATVLHATAPTIAGGGTAFSFSDAFPSSLYSGAASDIRGINGWTGTGAVGWDGTPEANFSGAPGVLLVNSNTSTLNSVMDADFTVSGAGMGQAFRVQSNGNKYWIDWSGTQVQVLQTQAGTDAAVPGCVAVSVTQANFTQWHSHVVVNGQTVTVYKDGSSTAIANWTLPSNPALDVAGLCGLRGGGAGNNTRVVKNFVASGTTGGGSSIDTTLYAATKTFAHSSFTVEFALELAAGGAGYVEYQALASPGNGYALRIPASGSMSLYKIAGGVYTLLQAGSPHVQTWLLNYPSRIRFSLQSGTLTAALDGEQQISIADSTYTTFASLAFGNSGLECYVRAFHIRGSDNLTVSGVQPGDIVTLRGAGSIPLASKTATGTSVVFGKSDLAHYPAFAISVAQGGSNDGDVYQGILWGGDSIALSAPSSLAVRTTLVCPTPSAGIAPYAYQWYKLATVGAAPGAGNLLAGETAQTLQASLPSSGTNYYACIIADATGASVISPTYTLSSTGTTTVIGRGRRLN